MTVLLTNNVPYCLQVLECGGNLFDAISVAAKAALFNAKYDLHAWRYKNRLVVVLLWWSSVAIS